MQILILPGRSSEDKEWVDRITGNLKSKDIIRPFYWMHWTDQNSVFDVDEKAHLIVKHLRGEKAEIIAKSEGLEVASIIKSLIPEQITSIKEIS